ncbi:amidohydrolase [Pseudemcibacter aquimaris]|uniref:amidohydrolase n=1 Tax=Pseudemcibacter aquimaris TaxID=2857064 RepID=UPI00201326F9|nr:amidohydrolase [Pseudemcibacter aquimaris]MCC3860144.1 amidohydrolase [Pseudemcibacter aquimaris]WDU57471.1 amidohydrolase [Pseudemcibacter aquimaris]
MITKSLLLFSAMTSVVMAQDCKPADIVMTGATVYTVNDNQPTASAIATRGDKIIYVGDDIGAERYACGNANVIDMTGKTIFPGFIDSHGHLMRVGFREKNLNLQGISSLADMLEAVKSHADANPDSAWITGTGWIETNWPEGRFPNKDDLDAIIPDRPVSLGRADGHASVLNTMALELAGITGETKSPQGGAINLDENGEPTGILVDTARDLVNPLIPAPTAAERKDAIRMGAERNVRMGWTNFQDAGSNYDTIGLFQELYSENNLAHRVFVAVNFGPELDTLYERGIEVDKDNIVTVRGIKVRLDGALGSRGAALLEPYSDYDTKGLIITKSEDIRPVLLKAIKMGFQVETHAIGDAANRIILDLYEEAFKAVPKSQRAVQDPRWRVEHAQNIQPEDVDRFIDLDVIPSMQASHAIGDLHFAGIRLGIPRLANAYLWRTLIDKGSIIAGGSDQPVEIGDPRIEFYAAVARKDFDGYTGEGWHPEYAVTREEALKMLTIWGAHTAFQENILGSIEVGKLADLSIMDKDIMTIPEDQIMTAENVMTVVNGKIVYQK